MIKSIFVFAFLFFTGLSLFAQVDQIVGRWKTIDDDGKTAKSIVHIFKATNGKYYGKIEKLFANPDKLCTECEGSNKNKPVVGMMIINGMVENEGALTGGTILDPNNGKVYHCNISFDKNSGKLSVRGSLDKKGWIGRSQFWLKEK